MGFPFEPSRDPAGFQHRDTEPGSALNDWLLWAACVLALCGTCLGILAIFLEHWQ